jgi:hypothetical protein
MTLPPPLIVSNLTWQQHHSYNDALQKYHLFVHAAETFNSGAMVGIWWAAFYERMQERLFSGLLFNRTDNDRKQ